MAARVRFNSAAITTTETVVATLTFDAVSGGVYATEWHLKVQQSVAGDWYIFSVREDSVSGTVVDQWGFSTNSASYGGMVSYYVDFTAAATGSKSLVGTLDRVSGTGNIIRSAKSNYAAWRVA